MKEASLDWKNLPLNARMVPWQALLLNFLVIMNQFMDIRATVTLTSSVDGRRACPEEVVTYTCTAIGVANIQWTAEPFLTNNPAENNAIIFLRTDTARVGQTVNCVDRSIQDCADFQATLLSITNSQGGMADMVSTLAVTAAARLNETVVQCRGTTATELPTANKSITITSPPSPALFQTPSYTVQEYDRDNVTIRVLWQSPQDVGWAPVINYTITISPGHVPLITRITSAEFTLLYNVLHNVSIVATNICGSSNAVMEVIPAIVGCGVPSHPENGSVQSLDISQSTGEGSQILFSCNNVLFPSWEHAISVCIQWDVES